MIWRGPSFSRCMIWLLPHSLPPSLVSKLSLFLSLPVPVCRRLRLLTGEGKESNNPKARKPGPLPRVRLYTIHKIGGVWCGEACCWWWRCTATGWPFTHSRPTGWASPTGRPGWLTGSGISTIKIRIFGLIYNPVRL
jgi:hypothetical protein